MNRYAHLGLLVVGLGLTVLLVGCPGMPGGPGGTSAAQQSPPGVQPPPGLTSGGVRTLLGTTVTPPDNSVLLVSYTTSGGASVKNASARRLTVSENTVLIEGLNFDGRNKSAPTDTNEAIPLSQITALSWSYEAKPTAPAPTPGGAPGRGGTRGGATPPGGAARGK